MPPTRTTVLFSPDTTFPTKDAFFDACAIALSAAFRTRTYRSLHDACCAVAVCSQYHTAPNCSFRVVVARGEGQERWALVRDRCMWTHSHGKGSPDAQRRMRLPKQSSGPGTTARKRRAGDEPSHLASNSKRTRVRFAHSPSKGKGVPPTGGVVVSQAEPAPSSTRSVEAFVPPDFPSSTATFPTVTEAFRTVYLIAARTMGTSLLPSVSLADSEQLGLAWLRCANRRASCGFKIFLTKDNSRNCWAVDYRASQLEHTHDPNKDFKRNSEWRPALRSPELRAALGLAVCRGPRRRSDQSGNVFEAGQDGGGEGERCLRSTTLVSTSPRASGSRLALLAPPPLAPSTFAACPPHTPRSQGAAAANSADLSAFLIALDPSLPPLTPFLALAGISRASLATLVALEPRSIDWMLELAAEGAAEAGMKVDARLVWVFTKAVEAVKAAKGGV